MNKEYIIKENRGSAFKSKSENPKAPQFNGTVNINGKEMWISLWQKKTQHGDDYFSIKFEEKRAKSEAEPKEEKKEKYVSQEELDERELNDDIPF